MKIYVNVDCFGSLVTRVFMVIVSVCPSIRNRLHVGNCLRRMSPIGDQPPTYLLITLLWVPVHYGTPGNKIVDRLAKDGSNTPFYCREPSANYLLRQDWLKTASPSVIRILISFLLSVCIMLDVSPVLTGYSTLKNTSTP